MSDFTPETEQEAAEADALKEEEANSEEEEEAEEEAKLEEEEKKQKQKRKKDQKKKQNNKNKQMQKQKQKKKQKKKKKQKQKQKKNPQDLSTFRSVYCPVLPPPVYFAPLPPPPLNFDWPIQLRPPFRVSIVFSQTSLRSFRLSDFTSFHCTQTIISLDATTADITTSNDNIRRVVLASSDVRSGSGEKCAPPMT
ncbi:unnamed protein product [Protopolystoma xenopodis]|uniref:Uncharacterized protein n=1 Tax=Protopolystoma xenopodis TaxID=117903 RepID=A0A3S5FGX0_9PLAT|nr:unnamed protein product [Protopolystoma xenopodis]